VYSAAAKGVSLELCTAPHFTKMVIFSMFAISFLFETVGNSDRTSIAVFRMMCYQLDLLVL